MKTQIFLSFFCCSYWCQYKDRWKGGLSINMEKEEMREILIRLRGVTDWSQKDFAKYFHIPRRTLQEWELGNRKMPEYLLRLMIYKLENENIVKDFSKIFEAHARILPSCNAGSVPVSFSYSDWRTRESVSTEAESRNVFGSAIWICPWSIRLMIVR